MSRAEILAAIQRNKPTETELPEPFTPVPGDAKNLLETFSGMVNQIGGQVRTVADWAAIEAYVQEHFSRAERIVTTIENLSHTFGQVDPLSDPHELADVSLAILPGQFGVAENAAIWLSDEQLGARALPFIAQHLAIVLRPDQLVFNMHEAYDRIADAAHAFGVFIAGPSKTADIEQSLVIGAHGARSLSVFIME